MWPTFRSKKMRVLLLILVCVVSAYVASFLLLIHRWAQYDYDFGQPATRASFFYFSRNKHINEWLYVFYYPIHTVVCPSVRASRYWDNPEHYDALQRKGVVFFDDYWVD